MTSSTVTESLVVVLDGPSGSGKSSVSRAVAQRLGLAYLDTGAMYRALTWWCLHEGVDLDDEAGVTEAARTLPLEMGTDPEDPRVGVAGEDVTAAIRETRISSVVSAVARHIPAREVLIARQRACIAERANPGIIAEGRDLTTVVAPDADVRLLLSASESARLARRTRELHGDTDEAHLEATRDQIVRRDR
ncbi:MAG: (d)CMP kinase, partial [Mobilicoccus sp.]|nr:(d)CMP kinase [Mobilicoccus sp.]